MSPPDSGGFVSAEKLDGHSYRGKASPKDAQNRVPNLGELPCVCHPVYNDVGVVKRHKSAAGWKRSQGRRVAAFISTLDAASTPYTIEPGTKVRAFFSHLRSIVERFCFSAHNQRSLCSCNRCGTCAVSPSIYSIRAATARRP